MTRLLLASGSPSRLRILREAGIEPLVAVPDVDEDALEAAHPDADVRTLVSLLAEAKAQAVVDRLSTDAAHEDAAAAAALRRLSVPIA